MPTKDTPKILIAEDDNDIRDLLDIALSMIGELDIMMCENGSTIIEKTKTFQPDLILLDVMMPIMDGPETIKKIREHEEFNNIPVFFLTAKSQQEEKDFLLSLGAHAVILKPFNPETISTEILEIWNNITV